MPSTRSDAGWSRARSIARTGITRTPRSCSASPGKASSSSAGAGACSARPDGRAGRSPAPQHPVNLLRASAVQAGSIYPTMWFKSKSPLGDFEQLVLFGVLRLEDGAYGAAIRQEIHARSGRDVSINAVYTTLDRLESKGLLRSWTGEPTPQRGGRRRKCYALRPAGLAALRQAYRAFNSMADGLEGRLETK